MLVQKLREKKMLVKKSKIKIKRIKIRTKMIKILTLFPGNGAKFDNTVVDAIKLILLIYKYC